MSNLITVFTSNSQNTSVHEIKVYFDNTDVDFPFRIEVPGIVGSHGIQLRLYSRIGLMDILLDLTQDWDYTPELFPCGKVCNLTQHHLTDEQVLDLYRRGFDVSDIHECVGLTETFHTLPSRPEMKVKAARTANWANDLGYRAAIMGGAPYYMPYLEGALEYHGIKSIYAFTKRVVSEIPGEDGGVIKKSVFKHDGWVGLD